MCFNLADAQINPPVVLPPSPQSNALITYNSPEVGLNTGTTQLSIPLFQIKKHTFSLPISLRYSTNGLKVDEIASRTGQNWILNSGGVITRSINGKPDEYCTRTYPPNDGTALDNSMLSYLNNASTLTNWDAEPDEYNFNFNGYAGKFIMDSNGQPLLIPHSNVKVLFTGTLNADIIIITPDGVKYEFATKESSYTENYCYTNPPGTNPNALVTSWYLTTVTLPNQEKINFQYEDCNYSYYAGISQSIVKTDNGVNDGSQNCSTSCSTNITTYCASNITLSGKRLTQITYDNVLINLIYQNRYDVPGDKLLSTLEIKESNVLKNKYLFDYNYSIAGSDYSNIHNSMDATLKYRPFLVAVRESGSSLSEEKIHRFSYNDIQNLPQRLSWSQDHYGFFNGKVNASFVPNVEDDPRINAIFATSATGNRTVDADFAVKGTLNRISYPGGGSDSLVYEANTYATVITTPAPIGTVIISGTSSASLPYVRTSSTFQINHNSPSTIFAGMLIPTDENGNVNIDPNLDLMEVQVVQSSNNSVVFSRMLKLGQQLSESPTWLSLSTNYYLRFEILYPGIKGTFYINYPTGSEVLTPVTKLAGGVRLSKLITKPGNGLVQVKKYYYARIDSLTKSSGIKFLDPNYLSRSYSLIYPCTSTGWAVCTNLILSSNSQKSIYNYGQSSIQYAYVTESIGGENFENGGVEHRFILARDRFSVGLVGNTLSLGDRYSNTGYLNGFEDETNYFKNNGGSMSKIKQVNNYYSVSPLVTSTIPAYVVNKHYDFPQHSNPPTIHEFGGYEMYKYTFNSRWTVLDSTVTKEFNSLGASLTSSQSYVYSNSQHLQPNIISTLSSTGKIQSNIKNYPSEMVSLGKDPSGVYAQMVAARNLIPVIEETNKVNNQSVSFTRTNYIMPYAGIFVPGTVDVQNMVTGTAETRLRFHLYNNFGSPLSLSKENGSKINYIWAYNGRYPVAEIKNADYSAIESIKGVSAISAFRLTYPDKSAVDTFVAALKTGLPNAEIITSTYTVLTGITSMTDAKGKTTYYEYDNFQRLQNVKDQDGNIIKNYDYHYKP